MSVHFCRFLAQFLRTKEKLSLEKISKKQLNPRLFLKECFQVGLSVLGKTNVIWKLQMYMIKIFKQILQLFSSNSRKFSKID